VTAVDREFVGLGPEMGWGSHMCQGFYHRPAGAPPPRTACIAAHYNVDFSEHYLAELMAERGFGFLGFNTRFRGLESHFLLEPALEDLARGVEWLREHGAETIVLLGNSGGGSLLAAYQAEHGDGDLYLSVAAHPGRPDVLTNWLDASALDEFDPLATDPALDMYDNANGPPYSEEFLGRYREGQRARNRRITAWAQAEIERVREAGFYDRVFTLQRTWADPRMVDPAIDPSDRPTPACYAGEPARANRGVLGIGIANTLRTWLDMWSLEHSKVRGERLLGGIEIPALVVQATMDTGVFPSDARQIHDGLASADKALVELPGDHYFRTPDGARERLADTLAEWVAERAAH
jgi:pimeloyl-ACP methyl ester carboxylesterase